LIEEVKCIRLNGFLARKGKLRRCDNVNKPTMILSLCVFSAFLAVPFLAVTQ